MEVVEEKRKRQQISVEAIYKYKLVGSYPAGASANEKKVIRRSANNNYKVIGSL
jgi:hypothetical protein